MTTLTDRYVLTTLRAVPEDQRLDLGDELRSTITDMVDARVEAGASAAEAERAALTELGDPARLAARYTGARLQLLGPRFYLVWKRLLVQLLTVVPAAVAALVAVAAVLDGDTTVGEVVVDAGGAAVGTAMQLVLWTTAVFAVLDRVVTDAPEPWTVDDLPEAPSGDRGYSLGEAAASIAWYLVLAAALVLQQTRSWVEGTGGEDVAILDPALWSGWLPLLLVAIGLSIGLEVWKYRRGWTPGVLAGTVVTSVAFSAPVAWLASQDRLLNPEFVEAVDLSATGQDVVNLAVGVGAVAVAVWEVAEAVVRTRRLAR